MSRLHNKKLARRQIYKKKCITNEDDNITQMHNHNILLFIFISSIFFSYTVCLMREDLLSTILYEKQEESARERALCQLTECF